MKFNFFFSQTHLPLTLLCFPVSFVQSIAFGIAFKLSETKKDQECQVKVVYCVKKYITYEIFIRGFNIKRSLS